MCYLYAVWLYRPDRRVQRFRTGQRAQWAMTGPEGPTSCGTGGSRWDILTGGSGLASSGVFVVCGILGNSLSIYAYSCCVWCLRYQRGPWEGDGLTRTHTLMEIFICRDLGICFWKQNWLWILICDVIHYVILEMKNYFENLRCYKLVSEPWFEGFGCTFGRIWTQTEDLRNFQIKLKFSKKKKRFWETSRVEGVYGQPAPERWIPKIPLHYMSYEILCCTC